MDTPAFATASTSGESRLIDYEQSVKVPISPGLTNCEKQRKESYVSEEERTTLRTGRRPVPVAGSGTDLWLANLLLPLRQRRRLLAHRQARGSGRERLQHSAHAASTWLFALYRWRLWSADCLRHQILPIGSWPGGRRYCGIANLACSGHDHSAR